MALNKTSPLLTASLLAPQTGTRNALRHRQRNCAFKKLHQSLLVVKLLVFQVSDCLEEFSGYVGDNNMKDP